MLLGVDCPCSSQSRLDACAQLSQIAMSLLRYMQVVPRRGGLPDPAGPLSLSLSPSAIEGANAAVTTARQKWLTKTAGKRGPYLRLDNEARTEIGKYASESSDTEAARHFSKVLGESHNRSTFRSLKKLESLLCGTIQKEESRR